MASGPGARTTVRLAEIAAALGAELRGDGSREIARIGALEGATPQTISFLAHARLRHLLAGTRATCIIVREDSAAEVLAQGAAALVTADPYLCYARLTRWWAQRHRAAPVAGIHASAVIAEGARIHPTAAIGPLVVVEPGAHIGEGAIVGAQCFIGDGAVVSEGARLHARATLGAACVLGRRSVLHGGAVVGSDGFGFAPTEGRWEKIEQLGAVSIGDDVEIGANTCVDRGALDDTVIEEGVKLDNLIQIAHNVRIGAHTAMAGCVGVAGSARIGRHCTFGGAAMILGHLEIADHVHISAASVVMSSILRPGQYSGVFPIDDNASWEKNAATLRQLHTLRARLRALEKKSST